MQFFVRPSLISYITSFFEGTVFVEIWTISIALRLIGTRYATSSTYEFDELHNEPRVGGDIRWYVISEPPERLVRTRYATIRSHESDKLPTRPLVGAFLLKNLCQKMNMNIESFELEEHFRKKSRNEFVFFLLPLTPSCKGKPFTTPQFLSSRRTFRTVVGWKLPNRRHEHEISNWKSRTVVLSFSRWRGAQVV